MQPIRLREKARLEREAWNPESAESEFVWHFSIPNFDDGAAKAEEVATIKSGKTLITKPCVLVSKLNPRTPRVWLIEHLKPGVNVCSTEFLVVAPLDSRDLRYLYFVLKSPSAVSRLAAVASGSSTSHQRVRPSEVEALELGWEESSSRRQWVADCLWEIEEKIKANRNTSRTLEELAAALFKSWFIDFAPVKAKMAAQEPVGMDAETAALFSDSMEESELGKIPRAWRVRRLGDLALTLLGGTPSRKQETFWGGNVPWINSGKMNDFRVTSPSEYITELGLEKSATKLLPKGTCAIAITGATLGQFTRLEIDSCANQSVVGVLESEAISNEFIYLLFAHQIDRLVSAQTGGAQQHINKNDVNDFRLVCPPEDVMAEFTRIVRPIFDAICLRVFESESLRALRDVLLPRLISGELEIPDEMLAA